MTRWNINVPARPSIALFKQSVSRDPNVPHVWAYVGEKPGRMLMGFTPAGRMEDFFTLSSKHPVDAEIAEAHGVKWLGPPLDVSKLVG